MIPRAPLLSTRTLLARLTPILASENRLSTFDMLEPTPVQITCLKCSRRLTSNASGSLVGIWTMLRILLSHASWRFRPPVDSLGNL